MKRRTFLQLAAAAATLPVAPRLAALKLIRLIRCV